MGKVRKGKALIYRSLNKHGALTLKPELSKADVSVHQTYITLDWYRCIEERQMYAKIVCDDIDIKME